MTRGKKKKPEKCSFNYFIPHLIISFPTLRDSLSWRGDREEQRSSLLVSFNSSICGTTAPRKGKKTQSWKKTSFLPKKKKNAGKSHSFSLPTSPQKATFPRILQRTQKKDPRAQEMLRPHIPPGISQEFIFSRFCPRLEARQQRRGSLFLPLLGPWGIQFPPP